MSLTALLEKTQNSFVGAENGLGCSVSYTYFESNQVINNVRALMIENDFRQLTEGKSVISDEVSFLLLKLDIAPQKNDYITFNGINYTVEDFRPNGTGRYDLFCSSKKTFTGGTSKVRAWH